MSKKNNSGNKPVQKPSTGPYKGGDQKKGGNNDGGRGSGLPITDEQFRKGNDSNKKSK